MFSKKRINIFFVSIGLLLIGVVAFKLISGSVVLSDKIPQSYDECVRDSKSSYNGLTCEVNYFGNNKVVDSCLNIGGCNPASIDGAHGCTITFVNSSINYPKNYQECSSLLKGRNITVLSSISKVANLCSFFLNSACTVETEESRNFMNACPQDYDKNVYESYSVCQKEFSFQ